jgi:hypothetical protein
MLHYILRSHILTIIRWNAGAEGEVVQMIEASSVALSLLYLHSA